MVRQQSTRSRYMIGARYVGTPGKKTPSLLGGEGSSRSLGCPVRHLVAREADMCWHPLETDLRSAGDQLVHYRPDFQHEILSRAGGIGTDGGERRPGITTDYYCTWWCTYFTDAVSYTHLTLPTRSLV